MNIRSLRICSIPISISSPEIHVSDTCFLHELHIMEWYVTLTYRLNKRITFLYTGLIKTTTYSY